MTFTFGKSFQIHVFGASHSNILGVSIEGCPPGINIDIDYIQHEMDRRSPGKGKLSSGRREPDKVEIQSGIFQHVTTGAPIHLVIENKDIDSNPYEKVKDTPRPGHADYTARIKYLGHNDYRGGGIFSGRMTAAFVMAGAVAKIILRKYGIKVIAHTIQIGKISLQKKVTSEEIEKDARSNPLSCVDLQIAKQMEYEIKSAKELHDSIGGVIECRVLNMPPGVGEPIFDSVESCISHAMFSIPAVKGIEFGVGFEATRMMGSEHNDELAVENKEIFWKTNNAGGVLGGLTNGAEIQFRVAVKPTPSISKTQKTVNLVSMNEEEIEVYGRHDPCIVPRAIPVVESLTAIIMLDLLKRNANITL